MTARFREAVSKDLLEIIDVQIAKAKGGDQAAAALLTARFWPPLRPESLPVEVPGIEFGSLTERAQAALSAAGRGDVSIDAAATVVTAVAGLARIQETEELEKRLAALEKKVGEKS